MARIKALIRVSLILIALIQFGGTTKYKRGITDGNGILYVGGSTSLKPATVLQPSTPNTFDAESSARAEIVEELKIEKTASDNFKQYLVNRLQARPHNN